MDISKRLIDKKLLTIIIVVTFLFVMLVSRLFYLQIINADELVAKAYSQWTRDLAFTANRGEILDRNGVTLASSNTSFTLYARPNELSKSEDEINKIIEILDIDKEAFLTKINKKVSEVKIATNISNKQMLSLVKLNYSGYYLTVDSNRYYPFGNFLTQTIGFTSSDNVGISGLELLYNAQLMGIDGASYTQSDLIGNKISNSKTTYLSPLDGFSLNLTIDSNMQLYVEQAVKEALIKYSANSASCIMMNANTGEILSIASAPTYDLNNIPRNDSNTLNAQSKQLIISDVYEPGSTFKIITSAIGLEEDKIKKGYYCPGFHIVDGQRIKCWKSIGHGSQNFAEGICNSCNCVFMDVALSVGKETFYAYLDKFGLKNKTGLDFPGESSSILLPLDNVKNVDLARIGFGQAIAVTPIQLICAVSSILNGGNLIKPYLVKSIYDKNTNIVVKENNTEIVKNTVSEKTSNLLKEYLVTVVEEGSGKNAKIDGYTIGGKNGTSQNYLNVAIAKGKYISSFLGFTQIGNDNIVCLFMVDEPKGYLYYGSIVAAPYVKNIFENTFNYLKIERKDYQERLVTMPSLIGLSLQEALSILKNAGLSYEYTGEQGMVNYQMPNPYDTIDKDSVVFFNVE